MKRHRSADDRSVRAGSPQPSVWEYVYILGGRVYTFNPHSRLVVVTVGWTRESEVEHLRALGREFSTPAEVNAYAAAHDWPNWTPLTE